MLGNNPYTRPDGDEAEIHKGELLLACSDGLSDLVSEERMLEALVAAGDDHEKGIDALIELAKGQGGRDNITVAIAGVNLVNSAIPRGWFPAASESFPPWSGFSQPGLFAGSEVSLTQGFPGYSN